MLKMTLELGYAVEGNINMLWGIFGGIKIGQGNNPALIKNFILLTKRLYI